MERDEQGETDAEDGQGNEEMAVCEDGSGLVSEFHGRPAGVRGMDWGNHKDAARRVSRMGWLWVDRLLGRVLFPAQAELGRGTESGATMKSARFDRATRDGRSEVQWETCGITRRS